MLKAVTFEAALIKTFPIAVSLGTDVDANLRVALLMIDPLLNESTINERNEGNSWKKGVSVDVNSEARRVNASDDEFSKSLVNVSPTDLKLSRLVTNASVVEVVAAALVGVVVALVAVVVALEAVVAALEAVVVVFTAGDVVVKFAIFD